MENIEKKIVNKVYVYETRKTGLEVFVKVLLTVLAVFLALVFGSLFISDVLEQRTLDLLEIFQEDREVIQQYLSEVLQTFYIELPKPLLVIFLVFLLLFITLILTFYRRPHRVRNRVRTLVRYWLGRRSSQTLT